MSALKLYPSFIKIRFLLKFLFCVLPHATCRIPAAICHALCKKLPLAPSSWNGFTGALMANTHPAQLQAILPPTIDAYDAWVSSREMSPARGGYVMPLLPGHPDWMENMSERRLQMTQGILALKHVLDSGYQPSNIISGGDSAGGYLALGVLAHLHRPRPTSEREEEGHIDLQGTIKGFFLVSPLSSFGFTAPSYQRWFSAGVLIRSVVDKWGQSLLGMALDVRQTWWGNLNAVGFILATGGYEEVFSDDIHQLGAMLRKHSKGEVTLYMENEANDGPLMVFAAGRPPSATSNAITDFIIACLKV
ncbi:hypothetical protein BJY01DRAFT_238827 [Aspergillus pseudoustus]|uniref:Alpha/beta hydrolase fold-3 domain-containing protein n=1 Tax=Aspergillus pseudoustus TaxID=1810923 RepID=A0ABR4J5X6_9EURO